MDLIIAFLLLCAIILLDFIPLLKGERRTSEIIAYAALGITGFAVLFLAAAGVDVPSPARLILKFSQIIFK